MARRRRVRSSGIDRNSRGLWRGRRGRASHSGSLTGQSSGAARRGLPFVPSSVRDIVSRAFPIEINARRRKSEAINHPIARDTTPGNWLADDPIIELFLWRRTISKGKNSVKQGKAVFLRLALRADTPQSIIPAFLASRSARLEPSAPSYHPPPPRTRITRIMIRSVVEVHVALPAELLLLTKHSLVPIFA